MGRTNQSQQYNSNSNSNLIHCFQSKLVGFTCLCTALTKNSNYGQYAAQSAKTLLQYNTIQSGHKCQANLATPIRLVFQVNVHCAEMQRKDCISDIYPSEHGGHDLTGACFGNS